MYQKRKVRTRTSCGFFFFGTLVSTIFFYEHQRSHYCCLLHLYHWCRSWVLFCTNTLWIGSTFQFGIVVRGCVTVQEGTMTSEESMLSYLRERWWFEVIGGTPVFECPRCRRSLRKQYHLWVYLSEQRREDFFHLTCTGEHGSLDDFCSRFWKELEETRATERSFRVPEPGRAGFRLVYDGNIMRCLPRNE